VRSTHQAEQGRKLAARSDGWFSGLVGTVRAGSHYSNMFFVSHSPSPASACHQPKEASGLVEFFNFYIIYFLIFQNYMPQKFFCRSGLLSPVQLAVKTYRRMNRRYVCYSAPAAGSSGGTFISPIELAARGQICKKKIDIYFLKN